MGHGPESAEHALTPVADRVAAELRAEVARLEAENARLRRLLELTPREATPPGPAQAGWFEAHPGGVHAGSPVEAKVAFYAAMFAARTDVYATRWENAKTGKAGWLPAVSGRWRKGVPHGSRDYLPLTPAVLTAHLTGDLHVGLYPLLDGDRCWWLAADFDGAAAMLDALAYLKAARASSVPAALEGSRSGLGAHVWVFFTASVPAEKARRLGTGLLREAMAVRGRMSLASYDRLFPAQDVLPPGGIGNQIGAPLQGRYRRDGATVFLDVATMEPQADQWAFLSSVSRMSPRELTRAVDGFGAVRVGAAVDRLTVPTSTRTRPQPAPLVKAQLGAGITLSQAELTPALLASLKHAASMPNPEFYERQRRRASVWKVPRFICSFDETLDGHLVLPRGLGGGGRDPGDAGRQPHGGRRRAHGGHGPGAHLHGDADNGAGGRRRRPRPARSRGAGGSARVGQVRDGVRGCRPARDVDVGAGRPQGVGRPVAGPDRRSARVKAGQLGGGRTKTRGTVDVAMLQTLARRTDVAEITAGYGLVVVDECHHVPAAAFEHAVKQIPVRRWLGLTATPYRRDKLDDLIALQVGPVRHTIEGQPGRADDGAPRLVLEAGADSVRP